VKKMKSRVVLPSWPTLKVPWETNAAGALEAKETTGAMNGTGIDKEPEIKAVPKKLGRTVRGKKRGNSFCFWFGHRAMG